MTYNKTEMVLSFLAGVLFVVLVYGAALVM